MLPRRARCKAALGLECRRGTQVVDEAFDFPCSFRARRRGAKMLPCRMKQGFFALRVARNLCHTSFVVSILERNRPMSMHNHLAELERRHKALEREIETEKLHLSTDDLRLVEMKRKKLLLKDQIQKLRTHGDLPTLH
jgi:hypothetical protein